MNLKKKLIKLFGRLIKKGVWVGFLFFSSGLLIAQSYYRQIIWDSTIAMEDVFHVSGEMIRPLRFEGAVYPDRRSFLPYYGEDLPLASPNYKVSLKDYQATVYMNTDFFGYDKLPDAPEIQSRILKDREQYMLAYSFCPVFKKNGQVYRVTSFEIGLEEEQSPPVRQTGFKNAPPGHTVLSSGQWHKISVTEHGMYKITYEQLLEWGIADPDKLVVYGYAGMLPDIYDGSEYTDLPQVPLSIEKGADGVFNQGDYITLYLHGPDRWFYQASKGMYRHEKHVYTDKAYYFIGTSENGLYVQNHPIVSQSADLQVTVFDDRAVYERNESHIIKSGREMFSLLKLNFPLSFSFNFSNVEPGSEAKLFWRGMVKSSGTNSYVQMNANANSFQINLPYRSNWSVTQDKALEKQYQESFTLNQDKVDFSLTYLSNDASSKCWLDYVELNVRRRLMMTGSQMHFRDQYAVDQADVADFVLSFTVNQLEIWDVSSMYDPRRMPVEVSGSNRSFRAHTDELREYIAFYPEQLTSSVQYEGRVENQNIRGEQVPDMVILVQAGLKSYANQLATLRRSEGLRVLVLEPRQVYNEFSSGSPDPAAIRNMLKYFYDKSGAESALRYFLLFGDGSYDPLEMQKGNRLMTYQTQNAISDVNSLVADDYFGLLSFGEELDGLMDIAVGRLPVNTGEEASIVLDKITSHVRRNNMGDWRNRLTFIGDDGDNNLHMRDVNRIAGTVDTAYPAFDLTKIMMDAYTKVSTPSGSRYPSVSEEVNTRVNNGSLLFVYLGHGSPYNLSHEKIIDQGHVRSWRNADKLNFFITGSCEVARFDDHSMKSIGELLLLTPEGGSFGVLSTTRKVFANENFQLAQRVVYELFKTNQDGKPQTLGEAIRRAKNQSSRAWRNNRSFHLFADPSMTMGHPVSEVKLTSLNGSLAVENYDTLQALDKVTLSGTVLDADGQVYSSFSGSVSVQVFDRLNTITTLSNYGGDNPFVFKTRNSLLYKGKATVEKGVFRVSFIIPKDMSYSYMNGKISLYAHDQELQLHGYYNNFVLGGTSSKALADYEGPEIDLYLNDESFVSGGITDDKPLFIAHLLDSSGINTVGNGIGHELLLTINNQKGIVLNEYYVSDLNTYQSGRVEYQLSELEDGNYTARLKAWDVHNNSSEESIDFVVAQAEDLSLGQLFNYPNPFSTFTSFYFEHNQPNTALDVMIQVFSISGKLIKTIRTEVFSDGYQAQPIGWDGLDDYGNRIGRGVYIYRIKVKSERGEVEEKIEKLVILR